MKYKYVKIIVFVLIIAILVILLLLFTNSEKCGSEKCTLVEKHVVVENDDRNAKIEHIDIKENITNAKDEKYYMNVTMHEPQELVETGSIATSQAKTASPKKIEIPNASWESIFFEAIDELSEKTNWMPLREVGVPVGGLEIRIWIGFGEDHLQALRLCRNGNEWVGFYVQDGHNITEVKPQTNWTELWKKIDALGILVLPDSSTLQNERMVADGVNYVVEINDGEHYRTYMYGNPQEQEWSEAKKIVEIVRLLHDEFNHSLPPHISWGYWE